MRNVRVWFTKSGRAKYISHLDINRCMSRAVRRAGLPLWYTEGYNPHPYMTFSLPLPLGVESLCESMDIRIEDEAFTNEMVKERLNAVLPQGLYVKSVNDSTAKAKEIAFADYSVLLETEEASETVIKQLRAVMESGQLPAEKACKSGHKKIIKTINLYEYIRSCSLRTCASGQTELLLTLSAGVVKNANPILVVHTLLKQSGITPLVCNIQRQRVMKENMEAFQ